MLLNLWSVGGTSHRNIIEKNKSDVWPERIQGDIKGQSTAIFGLANLLGIQFMPQFAIGKNSICAAHMGSIVISTSIRCLIPKPNGT